MNGRIAIVACSPASSRHRLGLVAQEKPKTALARLTVERIFGRTNSRRSHRRCDGSLTGPATRCWEDSKETPGGQDLVRYDAATGKTRGPGARRRHLIPTGESARCQSTATPCRRIERRLLIFTNSKRVWRQNTRGDYWVLDRASRELRKLGGDAPPSSLMFAKFAPVGSLVAYVRRQRHLCRKPPRRPDHAADEFRIARRDQRHVRLGLRGGVRAPRWFPMEPRRQIDRLLATQYRRGSANIRSSTRPIRSIPGSRRSSIPRSASRMRRAGSASSPPRRGDAMGSPSTVSRRENYIAFMEWAGNSGDRLILQG